MAGKNIKNKNGDGHIETPQERIEKEEKEHLEKYERDRIERVQGMPPTYKVLYGQEGDDLAEVARLTNTEKMLFAIQVMQEKLADPRRKKRASAVFREAYMHNSIGVEGEGREDLKIIGQQALEQQAAARGQAFG